MHSPQQGSKHRMVDVRRQVSKLHKGTHSLVTEVKVTPNLKKKIIIIIRTSTPGQLLPALLPPLRLRLK